MRSWSLRGHGLVQAFAAATLLVAVSALAAVPSGANERSEGVRLGVPVPDWIAEAPEHLAIPPTEGLSLDRFLCVIRA